MPLTAGHSQESDQFLKNYRSRLQSLRQVSNLELGESALTLQRISELTLENDKLREDNLALLKRRINLLYRVEGMHQQPIHGVATWNAAHARKSVDDSVKRQYDDLLATASWDGKVRLFDMTTGGMHFEHLADEKGLYAVAFAKKENHLLGCASDSGQWYLFDFTNGHREHAFIEHTQGVNDLDFHDSQNVAATVSDDKTCKIWDYQQGTSLRTLDKANDRALYGCTFMGGEDHWQFCIAVCSFDRSTSIWDMRQKKVVCAFRTADNSHTDDIVGVDFSPELSQMATGGDDGFILLYDLRLLPSKDNPKPELARKIQAITATTVTGPPQYGSTDTEVKRVRYSPDGKLLAAAAVGAVALVDPTQNGAPYASSVMQPCAVFDVAWSMAQGKKRLAACSHGDHATNCPPVVEVFEVF
eukprot:TRINITY_DN50316_c0_g1_i1.p1 TRINITY_DN50316_c0_g1~~TRINITY_DN50316_c0_g1_i1.p1  ORF type:complete len:415 (-),score=67.84 TRINITY_DN50316_c0_g1_i1:211-1455(-)